MISRDYSSNARLANPTYSPSVRHQVKIQKPEIFFNDIMHACMHSHVGVGWDFLLVYGTILYTRATVVQLVSLLYRQLLPRRSGGFQSAEGTGLHHVVK